MHAASAGGNITLLHNVKVDEGHKSRFVGASRRVDESLAEVNTINLLLGLPEGGAVGKLLVPQTNNSDRLPLDVW